MDYALVAVVGILTLVAVEAFARQLGVAAPLLLIVVGVLYSFIPGVPPVEVPPEFLLTGVLPPLLYAAAVRVPLVDFRRNLRSIVSLSVLLVIVTALVVGGVLYLLFPDLNLASAIALGAVISPTDAVAATAIGKRIGLPHRLVTILEGESLVNDATALVLLKAALAAAAVGASSFDLGEAAGDFGLSIVVATAVGLVVGWVTVRIRARLEDSVLHTAISFVVPFISYLPSESLGGSGVLSVVVTGLYAGHHGARRFAPSARLNERVNWRTVQFLLENGVFLLMGLELRQLVQSVSSADLGVDEAVLYGLLVAIIILGVRAVLTVPLVVSLRVSARNVPRTLERLDAAVERARRRAAGDARLSGALTRLERRHARRTVDLKASRLDGLGWRGGAVLSWSGMRGVVTLAAAQSLPTDIPYRSQLVLIAFTVAAATLLLQGGTLPWVIRLSRVRGTDQDAERREFAELLDELSRAGLDRLDDATSDESADPRVVERARTDTVLRQAAAWEMLDSRRADGSAPHQQYRALRLSVIAAERERLLELRSLGEYSSVVLARGQAMLDLEESRLDLAERSD